MCERRIDKILIDTINNNNTNNDRRYILFDCYSVC